MISLTLDVLTSNAHEARHSREFGPGENPMVVRGGRLRMAEMWSVGVLQN